MAPRTWIALLSISLLGLSTITSPEASACCAVGPRGAQVVNADQTVIILWDAARQTQHFIRQATFQGDADNFGFLVPSPSQPELAESGSEAFSFLSKVTEPEIERPTRFEPIFTCCAGCIGGTSSVERKSKAEGKAEVRVLDRKNVAGMDAAVLEADSATALVTWLRDNGYAFSDAVKAWAAPYVKAGWKITALKVIKDQAQKTSQSAAANTLRLRFKTDRPLFPYREPDSKSAADALNVHRRLLRIYFLAEARYEGELTKEDAWTGKAVWSNPLQADQGETLVKLLKLPASIGPTSWWLTEFEDPWPYRVAPADVYFAPSALQDRLKRPPIIVPNVYHVPAEPIILLIVLGVPGLVFAAARKLRPRKP